MMNKWIKNFYIYDENIRQICLDNCVSQLNALNRNKLNESVINGNKAFQWNTIKYYLNSLEFVISRKPTSDGYF